MIIDCTADLHGFYPKLGGGDLLIIAGDLTAHDDPVEYIRFRAWLEDQDYKKKIIVPGNHDGEIELDCKFGSKSFAELAEVLVDNGAEFNGLKIWGSPWVRKFDGMNPKCMAFTLGRKETIAERFAMIPNDIDILVTHSPPYGIQDGPKEEDFAVDRFGSVALSDRLREVPSSKPFIHVFGHIHEGYGVSRSGPHLYVNASHVDRKYRPVNSPIRITLEPGEFRVESTCSFRESV